MLVIHFTGNVTEGLDNHLKWAKNVVAVQPDSKIVSHQIKIAAGNWADVTGYIARKYHHEFTRPLGEWQNCGRIFVLANACTI
ncbi:hypothetical protein BH23THE1_BH23THE1_24540 [soil metagenome]